MMQKIYEHPKSKYVWNFDKLGITYFEIPKTGSSSVKTALFRANYGLGEGDDLDIGGGKLARRFPDAAIKGNQEDRFLDTILIICRDPIARIKSAYRSIYIGRQKLDGSLSTMLRDYLPVCLSSPESDGLLNHYKPMSWFFPHSLIGDPRVRFVQTHQLNDLLGMLKIDLSGGQQSNSAMPHLLNVNKSLGDIDLPDGQIHAALGPAFDEDFSLFDLVSASA